jgi:Cu/Ag efflux pump CusA
MNSEVKSFNIKLLKLMKPFKHVKVVKVDPKREFFTKYGLHMNNVGKGNTALKRANVVTTTFQNQIEEPIRLYWKTEYEDGVNYTSSGDNIIMQEDPKAAT